MQRAERLAAHQRVLGLAGRGARVLEAEVDETTVATTTLDVHAGNIAPTAAILEPPILLASGSSGYGGWTVHAYDPDGEIVRYELDLDGDGTYETDQGRDHRIPGATVTLTVRGYLAQHVTDASGRWRAHGPQAGADDPSLAAPVLVVVPPS